MVPMLFLKFSKRTLSLKGRGSSVCFWGLGASTGHSCLQVESRELQASPYLSPKSWRTRWWYHHGYMKGKSCLTDLTTFYDEMTGSVDEGRADDVYLNFNKAFNSFPHNIWTGQLLKYGPGKWTVTGLPGPKGYEQQHEVQLDTSHFAMVDTGGRTI